MGPGHDPGPLVVAQRRLGQEGDHRCVRASSGRGQRVHVLDASSSRTASGATAMVPDRLLVPVVAHVEDRVPLAGPDLQLVVDLRDQGAHRVDHHPTVGAGPVDDLGRRAVGRQHQRCARRDLGHVVDEHHALGDELVDHVPVVDDLVVAVDGRLEDTHHPGQGLDGLLHPGAEAAGLGQEDSVDRHGVQATGARAAGRRAGDPGRPGAAGSPGEQVAWWACRRPG